MPQQNPVMRRSSSGRAIRQRSQSNVAPRRRRVCALFVVALWSILIGMVVLRPHFAPQFMDHGGELGKILRSNFDTFDRFLHEPGFTKKEPSPAPSPKLTEAPKTTEPPSQSIATPAPVAQPRQKVELIPSQKEGAPRTQRGGTMRCGGGRLVKDSEVVYWRDAGADALEIASLSRLPEPTEEQFLTFEYDHGGWNNVRMGVECVFLFAHYTRRTIVLPPAQALYLIAKQHERRKAFGLSDFLNVSLLAAHSGWRTQDMDSFLAQTLTRDKSLKRPRETQGPPLWKFMSSVSDEHLPPVTRKYFFFPNQTVLPAKYSRQLLERRHKGFIQGRTELSYDPSLASARHIHVPGGQDHRILMSFYSFALFEDPRIQHFYRRFIRDYARYTDEIFCAADLILRELRKMNTTFYALHVRRNDFQYKAAKISASTIIQNLKGYNIIPKDALVYLATDDPKGTCAGCMADRKPCHTYPLDKKPTGCPEDSSWDAFDQHGWKIKKLGDFASLVPHLNPNYYGMVDQVICARAKVFAGTYWSTFTGYIHRLRGYYGLAEDSYYHSGQKFLYSMQDRKSLGTGWVREWRAGWKEDDDY